MFGNAAVSYNGFCSGVFKCRLGSDICLIKLFAHACVFSIAVSSKAFFFAIWSFHGIGYRVLFGLEWGGQRAHDFLASL